MEVIVLKCSYCGNEVPEGETYCSCGHPVTIAREATAMPDLGTAAYSAPKKSRGRSNVGMNLIVFIIVALLAGGYFLYRNELSYTVEKLYHEVSTSDFSITIPTQLKKSDTSEAGVVGFYTSKKAAVSILVMKYDDYPMFKDVSIDDFAGYAQLGGFDGDFKKEGDMIYATYTDTAVSVLGEKQECYVIEGIFKGEKGVWSVNAYCRVNDKDKMEEHLLNWVRSFEEK